MPLAAPARAVAAASAALLVVAAPGAGQQTAAARSDTAATTRSGFDLSVRNVMRGPELYGREPQQVRWSPDGRWIYFSWLEPGATWNEPLRPYRVRAEAGARPERLTDARADSLGPAAADGVLSRDRRLKAVTYRGDVFVVDMARGTARRLTQTTAPETGVSFDADARRVFFAREGNAFAVDLATGATAQLTDLRSGTAPDTSRPAGQRGRLADQQRTLLGSVRDQLIRDSLDRAERERRDAADRPKAVYVGEGERVVAVQVSPRGDAALVTTAAPPRGERVAQVPNYVTASGFTEEIPTRSKVGDTVSSVRVGLLRLPESTMTWLPLAGPARQGAGVAAGAARRRRAGTPRAARRRARSTRRRWPSAPRRRAETAFARTAPAPTAPAPTRRAAPQTPRHAPPPPGPTASASPAAT
jgi:hypothetical protein